MPFLNALHMFILFSFEVTLFFLLTTRPPVNHTCPHFYFMPNQRNYFFTHCNRQFVLTFAFLWLQCHLLLSHWLCFEGREKLDHLSNGLRSLCRDEIGVGSPFELG